MMKAAGTRIAALFFLASAAGLAGCAGAPRPETGIGWPPPPSEPVIVYERSIYGSQDLDVGFFGRIKDFLFGRSPDTQVAKPWGVAYADDRLYVAETGRKEVMVLDLGSGRSRTFSSLGPHGRLREPVNVAVGPSGEIYVADTGLGRLVVFDENGNFLRFFGAAGDLDAPVGMAFHRATGRLYVADSRNHRVVIYGADGGVVGGFGRRGDQRGEFYHPLGVAISRTDTVYVVDSFHFAVQAFDLDGGFLFSFGHLPSGVGEMARPRGIALDSEGHVYVSDALNNNVQMYDAAGEKQISFGGDGTAPGRFRLPAGVCVAGDDRIFVVDSINRRIQQFRYRPVREREEDDETEN